MKIHDFIKREWGKEKKEKKRMFPLAKSTEVRQVPKGKAEEKRKSSNSHLMPKMEQGWEWCWWQHVITQGKYSARRTALFLPDRPQQLHFQVSKTTCFNTDLKTSTAAQALKKTTHKLFLLSSSYKQSCVMQQDTLRHQCLFPDLPEQNF